jgi:hypothetical protein
MKTLFQAEKFRTQQDMIVHAFAKPLAGAAQRRQP